MRILLIDVNCKYSSTGKIVYSLYQGLRKEGHEAAICYGRGSVISEPYIFKFGLDWETNIHAGLARITGLNGYLSFLSTRRLIKFIEQFNPDVIHIHELHAYFVNFQSLLKYIKKKEISVVWTFHCEYMYTGKCGYAYECKNWNYECGNCPAIHEYPQSLFFDFTRKMLLDKRKALDGLNPVIVTPSKWLADRVKQSFLSNCDIKVIHNGIDTSIFHKVATEELRSELKIDKEKKVVLFVAPDIMDERKGGHWVMQIAKKMKDENIIFLMVGGGNVPKRFPNNTLFAGPVYDSRKLAQFYSLADVFLLCSEKETYSMACAEALCCGTPIVGFKCGAPETVFSEPYAKFVEYGDIIKLIHELRIKLVQGEVGKKIYSKYSDEKMLDGYIKVYLSKL